jgi:glycosyltransferase involved in cell wall biosynthesis
MLTSRGLAPLGLMLLARQAERAGEKVIMIATPHWDGYSETFIRDHIERLPARVEVLSGSALNAPPATLSTILSASGALALLAEFGPTGVAVQPAAEAANIPLIVHFHGYDAYAHALIERQATNYARLFARASAIIAVSRDMERQLLRLGAPREKVHYNPCGVDTDRFSGGDPAAASPRLLAVGRFVDKKAPQLTLLAFKQVADRHPTAQLLMIGEGSLLDAMRQLVGTLGLTERVTLLGRRDHAAVAAMMRTARAFVQHSMRAHNGDMEGTPVAILEACATGLPVIATRHGGIPDVVIDGATGFLIDEGDVDGMAERMLQLCDSPGLAAQFGRAARERVCAEYSMDARIHKLWCIIEGVADRH